METKVLSNSTLNEVKSILESNAAPLIFELTDDVDLGNEKIVFRPGDTIVAKGGTLGNGTIGGQVRLEDTCLQVFSTDSKGEITVTFDRYTVLNVPHIRPEWFGAKGDLVFTYAGENVIELTMPDMYNKGECTDDSAAINEAIRVAEELSIKTVKFNAVNYFVKTGIKIGKGNIHLEGSGALLREDQWYEGKNGENGHHLVGIWNSRTSTLFCSQGVDLITIGERGAAYPATYEDSVNPGDPIVISNLQLWTEGNVWSYYNTAEKRPSGINYCTYCSGPLWPFIVERCHFRNFCYAIHLNTEIDYAVTYLRVNECAFFYNMYCLCAENQPNITPGQGAVDPVPTLQTTWSLEFTRNKCHGNGFAIKAGVGKGPCRVEHNNLEGARGLINHINPEPGKGPDLEPNVFVIDLELSQRAAAVIRYNHFEQSSPRIARVKGFWGNNWVTMRHNNTDGNANGYESSNLCYFDSVILNTDEDAEVKNCILENVPSYHKKLIIDAGESNGDNTDSQMYISSSYLRKLPTQPLVGDTIKAYYKVSPLNENGLYYHTKMQTPMGNMMMRCYNELNVNYEHGINIWKQDFDIDFHAGVAEPLMYVTIDFPLINECNTQPLVICNTMQYDNGTSVNKTSHTYMYYDKGGFFNVRQQFMMTPGNAKKVNISGAVKLGTKMPIDGRFYIGDVIVMFSDSLLDMNYRLIDDRNVPLAESDSYLLNKGDFVMLGNKPYLCLEEGYKSTDTVPFTKEARSNVISVGNKILPIGSIWQYSVYRFKVLAAKAYNEETDIKNTSVPRYTNISYVVETNAFNVALNGTLECAEPELASF